MHQLTIEQQFNTNVASLFNAWCRIDMIKRWFAPGDMTVPEATAEFREGGAYRIVMQDNEGGQHIVGGTYLEIIPNEKLTFSWQWEGSPTTSKVSIVFKSISENSSGLVLVHAEFADQESCDKHAQGWRGCLANLQKVA
jgi:uncharacterized protein YndB with AHSA1/START domain